jgi:hypothetical protein
LYPRMLERFAETGDPSAAANLMLVPVRAMAALMIALAAAAVVLLPTLIRVGLPKYAPAIPLVETLVPGAFFLGIAPVAGSYVIAVNHQGVLLKIQAAAMVCSVLVDGLLLNAGLGPQAVAIGTLCGYSIYGLGYLAAAIAIAKRSAREALTAVGELIVIFGGLVAAQKLFAMVLPVTAGGWSDVWTSALRLLLVLATLAPLVWFVNRNSGLFGATWLELRNWRAS